MGAGVRGLRSAPPGLPLSQVEIMSLY